jgi:hypothetical protein
MEVGKTRFLRIAACMDAPDSFQDPVFFLSEIVHRRAKLTGKIDAADQFPEVWSGRTIDCSVRKLVARKIDVSIVRAFKYRVRVGNHRHFSTISSCSSFRGAQIHRKLPFFKMATV